MHAAPSHPLPQGTRRLLIPPLRDAVSPPRGLVRLLRGESMGTTWSVKWVDEQAVAPAELRAAIERELDCVVRQMSHWDEDSDLSRFSRAPGGSVHALPEEFFQVLHCALSIAAHSGGAYDPTVGRLVDLWGFGRTRRAALPPSRAAIEETHVAGAWRLLELDAERRTVRQPGGVFLDLSSIAKGFAVDQVARCLERLRIGNYLVEVGGELRGLGVKPDGDPWWVELHEPRPGIRARTLLALYGVSVATSGNYQRFFEHAGTRYSHTLDPRTAHPVAHDLISVSVVHRDCMAADAYSTLLTVLGMEQGMEYASRYDLAALFIDSREERLSPTLAEMLE